MALNIYQVGQRVDEIARRLEAIEDQLALVSGKVGVPYEKPPSTVPPDVRRYAIRS